MLQLLPELLAVNELALADLKSHQIELLSSHFVLELEDADVETSQDSTRLEILAQDLHLLDFTRHG